MMRFTGGLGAARKGNRTAGTGTRRSAPHWLIIRASSLFGRAGARSKGGNFVETVLAKARAGEPLKVVHDVRMSPTYTRDAAEALVNLFGAGAEGIVHVTNDGACTWYEFARAVPESAGLATKSIRSLRKSIRPELAGRRTRF
jgi:dTDP-4-dehydrorhamnose reductase